MASTVERIAERIAYDILSGVHAPGSRLPSIRALVDVFQTSGATMKVAMSRLEAAGFVTAVDRVGYLARDVRLLGGIDAWRYIIRLRAELPELAIKLVIDVFDAELVLLADTLRVIFTDPSAYDPVPVRAEVSRLAGVLAGDARVEPQNVTRCELAVLRALVAVPGNTAQLAIFNSVGDLLMEIPEFVDAAASDRESHLAAYVELLRLWEAGTAPELSSGALESMIGAFNAKIVRDFTALLGRSSADARLPSSV